MLQIEVMEGELVRESMQVTKLRWGNVSLAFSASFWIATFGGEERGFTLVRCPTIVRTPVELGLIWLDAVSSGKSLDFATFIDPSGLFEGC